MPRKSWWARLPFGVRMAAGTSALLMVVGGGAAGVATLIDDDKPATRIVTAVGQPAPAVPPAAGGTTTPVPPRNASKAGGGVAAMARTAEPGGRTPTRTPRQAADAAPPRPAKAEPAAPGARTTDPAVTTRSEVETREIPFRTRLVRDPALARGTKRVQSPGAPGEETLRYLVTLVDGQPTDRRLVGTSVTREPQDRVVAFGTATATTPAEQRRECGRALTVCVPLGRSAVCPKGKKPQHRKTESAILLGGSVTVLDEDVVALDALEGLAC